jgi:hypothetical protein
MKKLELGKIAIIGLGGTGSYVLDLAAKTPVKEIHLFDGDKFLPPIILPITGDITIEDHLEEFLSSNIHHGIKFCHLTFSLRVLPALNLTTFDAGGFARSSGPASTEKVFQDGGDLLRPFPVRRVAGIEFR